MGLIRVVIVALVAAAILIAFVIWMHPLAPREENRVAHAGGYSIVRPVDWDAHLVNTVSNGERDAIMLKPHAWKGMEPSIWVKRLVGEPDFARKALVRRIHTKYNLVRQAVFEVNGTWYDVGISLPGLESTQDSVWWPFAETFRPAPLGSLASPPAQPSFSTVATPATQPGLDSH
jgi:hypothetical protein